MANHTTTLTCLIVAFIAIYSQYIPIRHNWRGIKNRTRWPKPKPQWPYIPQTPTRVPNSCIIENCSDSKVPVCGIDRKTYTNECHLNCEGVDKLKDGPCVDNCFCSAQYDPVCGINGTTYANDCQRQCAGVPLRSYTACPDDSPNDHWDYHNDLRHCNCDRKYEPVCGNNGRTYDNSCFAICDKQLSWENGPCERYRPKKRRCNCGDDANEVCAKDGKVYKNSCYAACARVELTYRSFCTWWVNKLICILLLLFIREEGP